MVLRMGCTHFFLQTASICHWNWAHLLRWGQTLCFGLYGSHSVVCWQKFVGRIRWGVLALITVNRMLSPDEVEERPLSTSRRAWWDLTDRDSCKVRSTSSPPPLSPVPRLAPRFVVTVSINEGSCISLSSFINLFGPRRNRETWCIILSSSSEQAALYQPPRPPPPSPLAPLRPPRGNVSVEVIRQFEIA